MLSACCHRFIGRWQFLIPSTQEVTTAAGSSYLGNLPMHARALFQHFWCAHIIGVILDKMMTVDRLTLVTQTLFLHYLVAWSHQNLANIANSDLSKDKIKITLRCNPDVCVMGLLRHMLSNLVK